MTTIDKEAEAVAALVRALDAGDVAEFRRLARYEVEDPAGIMLRG